MPAIPVGFSIPLVPTDLRRRKAGSRSVFCRRVGKRVYPPRSMSQACSAPGDRMRRASPTVAQARRPSVYPSTMAVNHARHLRRANKAEFVASPAGRPGRSPGLRRGDGGMARSEGDSMLRCHTKRYRRPRSRVRIAREVAIRCAFAGALSARRSARSGCRPSAGCARTAR